jgi:hypothetical protein
MIFKKAFVPKVRLVWGLPAAYSPFSVAMAALSSAPRVRAPEPAWHRRMRAQRAQARLLAKLGSACQLLATHHGSSVPPSLHFLVAKFKVQQPPAAGPEHVCGACGWDNWRTRSVCRSCGVSLSGQGQALSADAKAFVPGAAAAACADAFLPVFQAQFENFAFEANDALAQLLALSASIGDQLVLLASDLAAREIVTPITPAPCGTVSLAFVNELLDSLQDDTHTQAAAQQPAATPVVKPSDTPDEPFACGKAVWITGLVKRPDLNDLQAIIIEPLDDTGRVGVEVLGSELFGRPPCSARLKTENLRFSMFKS